MSSFTLVKCSKPLLLLLSLFIVKKTISFRSRSIFICNKKLIIFNRPNSGNTTYQLFGAAGGSAEGRNAPLLGAVRLCPPAEAILPVKWRDVNGADSFCYQLPVGGAAVVLAKQRLSRSPEGAGVEICAANTTPFLDGH